VKCIAVINQKGGVGKTTTTANLGAALARMGYRVLLVDMDPQANLTVHLDQSPDLEQKTLTSLLVDDAPIEDLVQPTNEPNLFLLPTDTSLAGVEQVLANRIGRETILREALENFPHADAFDFCLLDCPPSLGVLSANALVAAQRVLVPVQAEYLSLQGMAKLKEVIDLVQKRLTPDLEIACILPCMVDSRTNLTAEVLQEIERHFGGLLPRTRIRNNVRLAEAPSFGRSIFEHAPESNGAQDYADFAAEFVAMEGIRSLGVTPSGQSGAPLPTSSDEADDGEDETDGGLDELASIEAELREGLAEGQFPTPSPPHGTPPAPPRDHEHPPQPQASERTAGAEGEDRDR